MEEEKPKNFAHFLQRKKEVRFRPQAGGGEALAGSIPPRIFFFIVNYMLRKSFLVTCWGKVLWVGGWRTATAAAPPSAATSTPPAHRTHLRLMTPHLDRDREHTSNQLNRIQCQKLTRAPSIKTFNWPDPPIEDDEDPDPALYLDKKMYQSKNVVDVYVYILAVNFLVQTRFL